MLSKVMAMCITVVLGHATVGKVTQHYGELTRLAGERVQTGVKSAIQR